MDTEQPITVALLSDLATALQMREEVPPRLLLRAMQWSQKEIETRQKTIDDIHKALMR